MVLQPVANPCYRGALGIVNRAYFGKATAVLWPAQDSRPEGAVLPRIFCQPAFDIGLHCFDHWVHMGIFKEMPSALDLLMCNGDPFLLMQFADQGDCIGRRGDAIGQAIDHQAG